MPPASYIVSMHATCRVSKCASRSQAHNVPVVEVTRRRAAARHVKYRFTIVHVCLPKNNAIMPHTHALLAFADQKNFIKTRIITFLELCSHYIILYVFNIFRCVRVKKRMLIRLIWRHLILIPLFAFKNIDNNF